MNRDKIKSVKVLYSDWKDFEYYSYQHNNSTILYPTITFYTNFTHIFDPGTCKDMIFKNEAIGKLEIEYMG